MKLLHICNVNFESELASNEEFMLETAIGNHPIYSQLQFLPVLYADKDDTVAVTDLPDKTYIEHLLSLGFWDSPEQIPQIVRFKDVQIGEYEALSYWGYTPSLERWAREKEIPLITQDLGLIRRVNSKSFTFEYNKRILDAKFLKHQDDLEVFLRLYPENIVFKTFFGVSGRGNLAILEDAHSSLEKILSFCAKEWKQKRAVIAERWVERILDFSTQWFIRKNAQASFLGCTVIENDKKGGYLKTFVGPEKKLMDWGIDFYTMHILEVSKVLEKMHLDGYEGHVGVDAMIFSSGDSLERKVMPIVEINARKTMSFVAINIQKKWARGKPMTLSFEKFGKERSSLLPSNLKTSRGNISFPRQLYFSFKVEQTESNA